MFKKMRAKRKLKREHKRFLKRRAILDKGVLLRINTTIWLLLTSWMFWRRNFNALLIGQYEYESLKRLPYAFSPNDLYSGGKDIFISWECPDREIEVIPMAAACGIKLAKIRTI